VATYTLTGDLDDLLGGDLTSPKAYLLPSTVATVESGRVRIGDYEIPLDATLTFSLADVPEGTYRVAVSYRSPSQRQIAWWHSEEFTLAADTDLSDVVPPPAPDTGVVVLVPSGATLTDNGDGTGALTT
jgi:hypothetical protein